MCEKCKLDEEQQSIFPVIAVGAKLELFPVQVNGITKEWIQLLPCSGNNRESF